MQLAAVGVEALQAPRQARGKVAEGATTEFSGYDPGRQVHPPSEAQIVEIWLRSLRDIAQARLTPSLMKLGHSCFFNPGHLI